MNVNKSHNETTEQINWKGLLLPLDTESTDGRTINAKEFAGSRPLPLMLKKAYGVNPGKFVGAITRIQVTESGVYGWGVIHDEGLVKRLRRGESLPIGADVVDGRLVGAAICEVSAFKDALISRS